MKTISVMAPPKTPEPRTKRTHRRKHAAAPGLDVAAENPEKAGAQRVLLHDVVNQLTVISLACFELRDPECGPWNEHQNKAIDAIETAIRSAAELTHELSKMLKDETAKKITTTLERSSDRTPLPNNVYPISPYLTRR